MLDGVVRHSRPASCHRRPGGGGPSNGANNAAHGRPSIGPAWLASILFLRLLVSLLRRTLNCSFLSTWHTNEFWQRNRIRTQNEPDRRQFLPNSTLVQANVPASNLCTGQSEIGVRAGRFAGPSEEPNAARAGTAPSWRALKQRGRPGAAPRPSNCASRGANESNSSPGIQVDEWALERAIALARAVSQLKQGDSARGHIPAVCLLSS